MDSKKRTDIEVEPMRMRLSEQERKKIGDNMKYQEIYPPLGNWN